MCKDPSQEAVRRGVDEHLKLVMENNPSITSKDEAIGLCKIRHDPHAVAGGVTLWPGVSPPCQHWPHCLATIVPRACRFGR